MARYFQLCVILLLVAMVCCGCSQTEPRSYYEKDGGFSYDPPQGWEVVEFPGLKYRVCIRPQQNDFAPNINVVDEYFSGDLVSYVDANNDKLLTVYPDLVMLKREGFQTEDGQSGVRMITENEMFGNKLRQTFYFFENGNRKCVFTCTALAEGGEGLDTTFERSMVSFRVH